MKLFSRYKRDNRSNMRFGEWMVIASFSIMTAALDIKRFSRPAYVGKHRVPKDLNSLTMGQLIELSSANRAEDAFYYPCRIILGMTDEETSKALAVDVVRFAGWCAAEVQRVTEVFGTLKQQYTPEEHQAGIDKMKTGIFGLIDWYARRMGITDHEEVERTPWVRIYECARLDQETAAYQRRLNRIIMNKNKVNK